MVIPSLEPFNEISSRSSYGSIPADSIEDGGFDDEEIKFHQTHSYPPHQRGLIEPQDGEVIDEVSIVANTINALLGVSLFSMPWGFQQAGLLGAIVILLIVGYLSYDTARMLLVAQKVYHHRTGEVQGYPEIAALSMGPKWTKVVQIATIISCLGGCTGYLIFFGESIGQALSMKPSTVLCIATVPLVLLSWTRSFRELTVFTVFGVIALVTAVLAILVDGSHKMDSDLSDVSMLEDTTIVNFIGPATFLFTIHYTVLALGAENLRFHTAIAIMDENIPSETKSALVTPIAWSYGLSVVLIAILGAAGFVMYRNVDDVRNRDGEILAGCEDHVCQNVLLNLSPGLKRNIVA
jgi:amino acid permease